MDKNQIQKYRSKSIPNLIQIATRHFNAFIRKRDNFGYYFICISCQKPQKLSQMQAGHFYPANNNNAVRFDEDNVHGQCYECNCTKEGNVALYKENLLIKIGDERIQELQQKVGDEKQNGFKWDRFDLIGIIEKYKAKINSL